VIVRILLLALAALAAAPAARQPDTPPPTITFFVGSDSHFGAPESTKPTARWSSR
jgi:hypothetical protein